MLKLTSHVCECNKQSIQVVKDMISTGLINLNNLNKHGYNPLHVAVKKRKLSLTELLLKNGAPVNAKTGDGETALSMAITQILPGTVTVLLKHNASLVDVAHNGKSALKLATELSKKLDGSESKEVETQIAKILNMILKHGINSSDSTQSNYYRLCKAIIISDSKTVKHLIRSAEDVNFTSVGGENPLEYAVYFYKLQEAELLLRKGANPDQDPGLNRESALASAMSSRSLEMVKLLLKFGAEVNFTSSFSGYYGTYKRTPLFRAAHSIDFEFGIAAMKELLSHGAKVSGLIGDSEPAENTTALHVACHVGFAEAVKLLLRHSADVNCRNGQLETPLHLAVEFPEIVKILLDSGAEVNAESSDGSTPLHRACFTELGEEIVSMKLLIESGADIKATDHNLETPLHYACHFCVGAESIKLLVEKGANLLAKDKRGRTILHHATENCQTSILKYVIDLVVHSDVIDINARDREGRTPLHLVYNELISTCDKFVECLKTGADHNVRSKVGDYPFHLCWEDLDETKCPVDEYVQRLGAIGYQVESDDSTYGFSQANLSDSYERELEELRRQMIVWNPRTSLYDLLFMKRNVLARYSANENLKRLFEECGGNFESKYPYYGSLLTARYRCGLHRNESTNLAKEYLANVLDRRVPEICSDLIFKYFSNFDLKNF